ncbi:hypothetical protein BJ508DRAFT_130396 [Ascobolus immersus RN42]|uniref:Uncharacterized protein n=1 Tax=Ascobolus immersus RN42 TaxID=1160509 RepID=A0A3N4I278_ASCIM|nr:hypothetical protein BJ508DRAFT_130396 [Ascobolus immersus RN42]
MPVGCCQLWFALLRALLGLSGPVQSTSGIVFQLECLFHIKALTASIARSYPRRPPKGWSTILKLLARFSLLNLPLASAGDAGDDFTNNLFSDLAPLLALFGEQVAKQYMSHSMSRIESFIFAMGPLGILTAVTGAIRVGGPTWLKALIGRAREGNGVVELELMSSTSADVCEMWNGNGVSRLMGTGEQVSVIEIIYYNEDADRTDQDPPSSSILRGFLWMRSQLEHFIGRFGRDVSKPSRSRADSPTPLLPYRQMAPLEPGFTQILNLQEAYRRGALKRCQCPDFPGSAKADQMTSSSHRTISDNEMLDDIPPNLGINLGRSRLSRTELMFAATIGVGLQAAVVAFAGIGAFHPVFKHDPDFQKEGRTIPTFAFPIFASGSLAVSLGTFLCAHIVEVSTQEITWEASTRLAKGLRMIWLQKGGFVNDQQFFSYTLSRRQRSNRIGGKALHVTRSCKANGKSVNTLTVSASVSTIVGFILQFIGLRNLSWTVSIAQLGVIGFMTAVRAFLRRGLVLNEVASHKLEEGQELASVVRTISGCDFFSIITAPQSIPEIRHHDPWKKRSAASDRRRASLAFLPHAVHVLQLSSQLRDFTNWENPRAAKAQALFECIEHTLQTYSSNDFELSVLHGRDTFSWNVLIEYSGSGQGDSGGNGTNLVEFRFSAWRERYSAGRGWGVWKLDREAKEQIGWAILQWEHEQFISTQTGTPDTPNSFRLIDTPREVYEAWISRGSVPSTLASIKMDRALTEGSSLSKSGIRIIGAHSEPRELPDSSLLLEVPPYNGDTTIYCQSFFSLFFSALSQYVRPLRSNDILYVCSGALNSESGPLITKASLRIRSRKLSALVDRLASIGLGNTEDILCCIVPALHSASHLPRTAFTVDTGTQCKWVFDEIQQEVAKLLRAGHIREADSLLLWLLDFTVTSASRIAASTRLQPFRHRKWQNILQLYGYILDVYDEVRNSMGADYARRAAHLVELVLEQSTVELMSSNEVLVYRDSVDLLVSKMENLVPDSRSLRQPWRKERWEKVMRLRHANEIRHLDRHCEGDSGAYIESFLSGGLVNDPECVLWLVHTMQKQGPDFNTVAGTTVRVDSSIALVSSALNRNTVAVQLLIEDPNTEFEVVDSMGRTAIHYAATGGMTSMLQLLLCDVRSRTVLEYEDNDGNTALQIAELNGDGAAVKLLLFYGAQAAENWAALDGYSCGLLHEKFMLDPDSRQTSPLQSVQNGKNVMALVIHLWIMLSVTVPFRLLTSSLRRLHGSSNTREVSPNSQSDGAMSLLFNCCWRRILTLAGALAMVVHRCILLLSWEEPPWFAFF